MAIIEATGLTRVFTSRRRQVEAVRGVDITVSRRRDRRLPRPERGGQDDHAADADDAAEADVRARDRGRADLLRDPLGVRRRIGYVAQAIGGRGGSDPNSTVAEELRSRARCTGSRRRRPRAGRSLLTEKLELGGLQDRLCKTLSGGQRRRLDIALGLVHSPGLIFLDEPTTGLDPQSRSNLWEHIRVAARGAGHDRLPDHALPGRGRRAVRPGADHRPRRRSSPRASRMS